MHCLGSHVSFVVFIINMACTFNNFMQWLAIKFCDFWAPDKSDAPIKLERLRKKCNQYFHFTYVMIEHFPLRWNIFSAI